MPTKSHTLIPYHLRDHNIQSWRNFLVEFESFVYRQIWAVLGRICCIDSG
jgi:hypothetical protein